MKIRIGTLVWLAAVLAWGLPAAAFTRQNVGTITANGQTVSLNTLDASNTSLVVTGTWTGTLQTECRLDLTTGFVAIEVTPFTSGAVVTSTTANGAWTNSRSCREFQVRASSFSSGTANISLLTTNSGGGHGGTFSISEGGTTVQVTTTAGGSLQVECTSGCGGSGGTSIADGATVTAGSTNLTLVGGYRDDASPGTVAEDKAGIARVTTNRALHVNLRLADGTEVTSFGGGVEYATSTATTNADQLKMAGFAVMATPTALSGVVDGDRAMAAIDTVHRLWTRPVWLTPNGDSMVDDTANVDALKVTLMTAATVLGLPATTKSWHFTTATAGTGVNIADGGVGGKVQALYLTGSCAPSNSNTVELRFYFNSDASIPAKSASGVANEIYAVHMAPGDKFIHQFRPLVESAANSDLYYHSSANGDCHVTVGHRVAL